MEKQFVTFNLDGDHVDYKLHFDFNEICNAEEVTGCNLGSAMVSGNFTGKQLRGLLYAFLKTAHPQVLLSEAGDLLSRDLPTTMSAFWSVVNGAIETEVAKPLDGDPAGEAPLDPKLAAEPPKE